MTRVLVTDAGRGSALSIVRSLGRRGIEVIAADANPRSPAFRSRYTAVCVRYPPPSEDGAGTVDAIARAAREHGADLVIPVGEDIVVLLSHARDRFADSTVLALPDEDALAVARNKLATVELARRVGVPTPRTVMVESAREAAHEVRSFEWPVVLKPQRSRSLRNGHEVEPFRVRYAGDQAELASAMRRYEGRSAVLLQEYCPGEGHGVGLLMDRGRPLLAFQHRRLREVPVTGGPSSFRESVALDPELLDFSVGILGALEWTGPAMVEFKVNSDAPKLMEVNGRLWGSLALAVRSGVDLPSRMVDLYLSPQADAPAPPDLAYETGVRLRDLALELSWISSVLSRNREPAFLPVPRRRQALVAAVQLFDPRGGFDVQSLDDPLPGLSELAAIVARIGSRMKGNRSSGGGRARR